LIDGDSGGTADDSFGCWVGQGGAVGTGEHGHGVAVSFADHLGLQPGDVLVELGGAAVFGHRELWFFMRQHRPGDDADAAWVRGGQLVRGRARLVGAA
jgi:hypothetical protein